MKPTLVSSAAEIPFSDEVGLDIETSPEQTYLRQGYVPPPDPRLQRIVLAQVAVGSQVYVLKDNFESLVPLLTDRRTVKIIHNANFEYKYFLHKYRTPIVNIFDTLLYEAVTEAGRRPQLGLDDVVWKYLQRKLPKAARRRFVGGETIDDQMIYYGAMDAWALPRLRRAMTAKAPYPTQTKVVQVETALVPAFVDIELRGLTLDRARWQALARVTEAEYKQVRRELLTTLPTKVKRLTMFGDAVATVNLNSKDNLLRILSDAGIDLPDLKKTSVAEYLEKNPSPLLSLYSRYQKLNKAVTTYGFAFLRHINPVTGRVHQNIKQVEARTGRLAGSDPNLMNIPKASDYRTCFRADKGCVLVGADYAQQEMRILAELCGDPQLIFAFETGEDPHLCVARLMFKDKTIQKDDPRRDAAKGINFGLVYGMGDVKLAVTLKIGLAEAQELKATHARLFPRAFEWGQATIEFAKNHGYVETLFGRRRYLDTDVLKYEREARNTPVQGSAADMIKLAVLKLYRDGVPVVNVVHDEILVECRREDVDQVADQLRRDMIWAGNQLVKKVPFNVDTYQSVYWQKK